MSELTKEISQMLLEQKRTNDLFAKALTLQEQKAVTGVMTANKLHGLNGLWSNVSERDVVSAHIRPTGISNILTAIPNVDEDPRYGVLTGFTAAAGDEPTNACEDAPSGFIKACTLTARFGMLRRDTNEVEIDKVMLRINRGDFTDLRLHGQVLGLTNLPPQNIDQSGILNILTKSEMVTASVLAERALNNQIWQGTWGVGTQFPGLDAQIATGQVDADENVACPAVDSDVKDFAYDDVEGGGRSIVEYMAMLEWFLYFNATRMGMLPVQWVWVMRPELWQVLTEVWPCQYNTNRCATAILGVAQNANVTLDGREMIGLRDSMRQSMTLEVNGRTYPVIVDDGIFESNNANNANLAAGEYASTIYFVPLTIAGGLLATWREYLDYRHSFVASNVALLDNRQDFWTDDGIFLWAIENQKYCYKLSLKTEQRVILRTPQLAGKIQNVKYVPLQHLRSSDPDSPYFRDGGVSLRNAGTFSAVWA
jgi:hypothetical protein